MQEIEEDRGRTQERLPRKTKWDPDNIKVFVPGIPSFVPPSIPPEELEALLIRIRIEEIGYKLQNNQIDIEFRRSPSPEPVYDQHGKRVNTKEQRSKEKIK